MSKKYGRKALPMQGRNSRYMNFDKIAEFREIADGVTV